MIFLQCTANVQCLFVHRDLKHLRSLALDHGCFNDSALCTLTGLTALRSLSLQYCSVITEEGVRAVVVPLSRQSLAHVDVTGCRRIPRFKVYHTRTHRHPNMLNVMLKVALLYLMLNHFLASQQMEHCLKCKGCLLQVDGMSVACCAVRAGVPDLAFGNEWRSPDPSDTDEDAPWEHYDDIEQEDDIIEDYDDEEWW